MTLDSVVIKVMQLFQNCWTIQVICNHQRTFSCISLSQFARCRLENFKFQTVCKLFNKPIKIHIFSGLFRGSLEFYYFFAVILFYSNYFCKHEVLMTKLIPIFCTICSHSWTIKACFLLTQRPRYSKSFSNTMSSI